MDPQVPTAPLPPIPEPIGKPISEDTLVDQLLTANQLEQAGNVTQARKIYEELVAVDPSGTYGGMAARALEKLAGVLPEVTPELPVQRQVQQGSRLTQWWQSLSIQGKLTSLIVTAATVPIVLITGVTLAITQANVQQQFRLNLIKALTAFEEEYILYVRDESLAQAKAIAEIVDIAQIDLNNPEQVRENRIYLQAMVRDVFSRFDQITGQGSLTKSFRLIVNRDGQVVAESLKLYADDFFRYPPRFDGTLNENFLPAGIGGGGVDLADFEIIQTALSTGESQTGLELVSPKILERLKLGFQAQIPLRQGSEVYEKGIVSMAVFPIQQRGGGILGAVAVGTLLNRNLSLPDNFAINYEVPIVSVFSEAVNVATTAPFEDRETRAIGTLAPADVQEAVLSQNQNLYFTTTRLAGQDYVQVFTPLYDHRRDPENAENPESMPVGMVAVGQSVAVLRQALIGQIATTISIAAVIVVLLLASSQRLARIFTDPVGRLADFARRLGEGAEGLRLEESNRQDELGVLERQMNQMASSLESTLSQIRRDEALRRQEAEEQRRAREALQRDVINLLLEIEGAQKGDLTVAAQITEGEVGSIADAFNTTIRSLRQLVLQVRDVAVQVNHLAQSSTTSVAHLAETAQSQAQDMTQTLAVVAEINQGIQAIAASAQEAARIAQQAREDAQQGDEAVQRSVSTITAVQEAVADTALKVQQLIASAQEIARIADTIESIAERTNLIAYNASLEALRAGEKGAGFGVVAAEVRRLSQQVSDSTRTMDQLLQTIQQESQQVVQAMSTGIQEVVSGVTLIQQTQQVLQRLARTNQEIDAYLQQISASVSEQSQASRQVNQSVAQVAEEVRDNAHASQEVVRSLENLLAQVDSLQASVLKFRVES